jgi:hypothetical protein
LQRHGLIEATRFGKRHRISPPTSGFLVVSKGFRQRERPRAVAVAARARVDDLGIARLRLEGAFEDLAGFAA